MSHFSDPKPIFTFHNLSIDPENPVIQAEVTLPVCVDPSVRQTLGQSTWITEKSAKRDAAFEAYVRLYHAGLISENLLPISIYDESIAEAETIVQKIASLVEISGQIDPWRSVAQSWQDFSEATELHHFNVSLCSHGQVIASMQMLLPCSLPAIAPINLYWDSQTTFTVIVQRTAKESLRQIKLESAAHATWLLLSSVYQTRMDAARKDFVTFFFPSEVDDIELFCRMFRGTIKGEKLKHIDISTLDPSKMGLVRDQAQSGLPYIFRGFQDALTASAIEPYKFLTMPDEGEDILLKLTRFPKRRDFLHRVTLQNEALSYATGIKLLPPEQCTIDKLPSVYSCFAALIPSVVHRIGIHIVARKLCSTLLAPLEFVDMGYIVTAISTSVAREATNYQRQEFLGDSVLKFLTSVTLQGMHLQWHEGLLSQRKDHLVSNASLARAALETGLDKFILTYSFTGSKWRPIYTAELLGKEAPQKRQLSTKTLADVVEALIGAAFLSGGFDKALVGLTILLPRLSWTTLEESNSVLRTSYHRSIEYPPPFEQLEQLIDYHFSLKCLPLEALTHSSYMGSNVSCSYERLEFLGDACLDNIIATASYAHEPPLATHSLHLVRTALVNADLLAFLCLHLSITITRTDILTDTQDSTFSLHIWNFMRHASPQVPRAQQACLRQYETLRESITESLSHGNCIPWALLARLDAPKFFSDIIESLIGAIYIDSGGSLDPCRDFLEHLGIMGYLRRVLGENVALYHPKEELGKLADTESVHYDVFREESSGEDETRLGCTVRVGDREVSRVGDGISVMEVETRAAEHAVRLLKVEKNKTAA